MIGTVIFFVLAAIAVLAAIGMLTSTNAVHSALFLVINFVCIALFYLGLSAPFLAMVQITVYAGAIMVLFLFVIMLLGAEHLPLTSRLRWQTPLAIFLAVMLIAVTAYMVFAPRSNISLADIGPLDPAMEAAATFGAPASIAENLFSDFVLPFELTSVLLLVAMIGAVVLVKEEKPGKKATPDSAEATSAD